MKKIAIISLFMLATSMFSQQPKSYDSPTASKEVKVFPNPATNVINILGLHNSTKAAIVISDGYGNVILNYTWKIKNNALNIPIANLKSGIYLISIRSKEQRIQKKFFKQ